MDTKTIVLLSFFVGMAAAWSYTGPKGKEDWNTVYPQHCGGKKQSPIDIPTKDAEKKSLGEFKMTKWSAHQGSWLIQNNGHALAVFPPSDHIAEISGGGLSGNWKFFQFHFHWGSDNAKGSEHLVDEKAYPLEVHMIFYNSKYSSASDSLSHSDGLAVFGVFFKIGNENSVIKSFQSNITDIADRDSNKTLNISVDLSEMLPTNPHLYYRYSGSLTTPECNEIVTWTVFEDVKTVTSAQLAEFRKLKENSTTYVVDNFRPPQPLNGRTVYYSVNGAASTSLCFLTFSCFLAVALLFTN